jgi:hypothetical protein
MVIIKLGLILIGGAALGIVVGTILQLLGFSPTSTAIICFFPAAIWGYYASVRLLRIW